MIMENVIDELKKDVDLLKSHDRPKIIFIGGVPGSGKSLLIKKAESDFISEEFSIIEPDLYRKFFKSAKSVEETVEFSNKIELELLLYSLRQKKNIIHISSLRSYNYINNLINKVIIPLNYEVYLYIICTNEIISAISTYERYINDKKNNEPFPRINKLEYLNVANEGFDMAVDFFSKNHCYKCVKIFRRGDNMSLPVELPIISGDLKKTVDLERVNQLTKLDYSKIYKRVKYIRKGLKSSCEIEEFNKVVSGIIFNDSNKDVKKLKKRLEM